MQNYFISGETFPEFFLTLISYSITTYYSKLYSEVFKALKLFYVNAFQYTNQ